jgi:hypothetical protein
MDKSRFAKRFLPVSQKAVEKLDNAKKGNANSDFNFELRRV